MTTSEASPRKEKLLRVQGPRSHTGCRTCKLRHVKCNEARPYCTPCIKAKRPCHYIDEPRDDVVKFVVYATQTEPSPFPGLTCLERRSLHHFQTRTAEELPSPFRSELWSNIMLNMAQYAPSIRHAVFALSSMHEYYASADESRGALHDYSMHHYNKAIRQLIRVEPEQSFDTLLLTALMFCALEGLKGDFRMSLQHAFAGIKIVVRGREGLPKVPDQPQIPDHMLPSILFSLQTQALELGDMSAYSHYQAVQDKTAPMPCFFSNTEEALGHCTAVMNEILVWFQSFETYWGDKTYIPAEVPEPLESGFEKVRQRFDTWNSAMNHIDTLPSSKDGAEHNSFLLLKMYQTILKIAFRTLAEGLYGFDTFEPELSCILSLAEEFLESQEIYIEPQTDSPSSTTAHDSAPRRTRPPFTFGLGVVPILFEIATSTRKPHLQAHAMRLLGSCNRREGVRNSKLTYKLAQKCIELQEDVDVITADSGERYRIFLMNMDFRTDEKVTFEYTTVRLGERMMDSFWLSGFNDPGCEVVKGEVCS